MKLFSSIAAVAVIGASLIVPNTAEAGAYKKAMAPAPSASVSPSGAFSVGAAAGGAFEKSRFTISSSGGCPAGTSFHHIKTGGLIFKKTVAKGCFTPYQAAQLGIQAHQMNRQRMQGVMNSFQNSQPRTCNGTVNTFGNRGTYSSTCY